jgi:hypothetical protein
VSTTNQDGLTSEQRRDLRKQNGRNFRRFWVIYVGLFCTALLSFISGLILPFMRNDIVVPLTWGTALVALYYGAGFLINGELTANFWFGKLTDQDPDNTYQKYIAWGMLAVSIVVIAATCISAADMIAFWVGVFNQFYQIPVWVQKYVVYAIPVMLVANVVMAMLFRGVSDEAIAEREEQARINQAMSDARIAEAQAYADYTITNAPTLARKKGEMRAAADVALLQAQINEQQKKLMPPQDVRQPNEYDEFPPLTPLQLETMKKILMANGVEAGQGSHDQGFTNANRSNGMK